MKQRSRGKTYPSLEAYVLAQRAQSLDRTQTVIAEEMGLTSSQLSMFLSGQRTPSKAQAIRLSREFNISLEGLLLPSKGAAA